MFWKIFPRDWLSDDLRLWFLCNDSCTRNSVHSFSNARKCLWCNPIIVLLQFPLGIYHVVYTMFLQMRRQNILTHLKSPPFLMMWQTIGEREITISRQIWIFAVFEMPFVLLWWKKKHSQLIHKLKWSYFLVIWAKKYSWMTWRIKKTITNLIEHWNQLKMKQTTPILKQCFIHL